MSESRRLSCLNDWVSKKNSSPDSFACDVCSYCIDLAREIKSLPGDTLADKDCGSELFYRSYTKSVRRTEEH